MADNSSNTNSQQQDQVMSEPTTTTNGNDESDLLMKQLRGDQVKFVMNYKKQNMDLEFALDDTVIDLKKHIERLTGIAPPLQKLMFKGLLKDDAKRLRDVGFKDGVKLMLVGSTLNEVLDAAKPVSDEKAKGDGGEEAPKQESLSEQLPHKKIIEKGLPEGAEKGKRGVHESLPQAPISNVYNNIGVKVRLTFKQWAQELWIQSASSTQKLPFSSIRNVTFEPIKGHEEYTIVSLQLGSSERTKYFLYWVPAQYTRAIRNVIMSADYAGGFM